MKKAFVAALAVVSSAGFGQSIVSAFDFNGTLNPFIDTNPPNVLPLEARNGGTPTTLGSPTYVSDTVGTVNKQVATFGVGNLFRAWHGIGANGGGGYVNQFSILMDVSFTKGAGETTGWASLFNTSADNGNDGDSFVRWDGEDAGGVFGSAGTAGVYAGKIYANRYNRLILSVNTAGNINYYLDGALINTVAANGVDGRYSMYTYNDGDTDSDAVDILGDNDGDNTAGRISMLAFFDGAMDGTMAAGLGTAGNPVPEPASMVALAVGAAALLRRRRR
ncbi:MAG: PEP-CTERM sorting domain-containing protein [Fimbriimonadaceae bacterium]|nr:PEP-CTERM sorting domain-containing protein [Fimbriimonadaceae bacterium]